MSDGVAPTWPGSGSFAGTVNCGTSSSGAVTLNWPTATDACSGGVIRYRVCRGSLCTTNWSSDYTVDNTNSLVVSSGLASNTTYTFYVRAEDGYGNLEAGLRGPITVKTKLSFASSIAPTFAQAKGSPGGCAGCHSFTYGSIVNVASNYGNPFKIIAPGSAATSSMYQKVQNTGQCGGVMPSSPFSVSDTWKSNLTTWITEGACNN
jgi:hypothetical protein